MNAEHKEIIVISIIADKWSYLTRHNVSTQLVAFHFILVWLDPLMLSCKNYDSEYRNFIFKYWDRWSCMYVAGFCDLQYCLPCYSQSESWNLLLYHGSFTGPTLLSCNDPFSDKKKLRLLLLLLWKEEGEGAEEKGNCTDREWTSSSVVDFWCVCQNSQQSLTINHKHYSLL